MARADTSIAFNKAFLHCGHGLIPSLAPCLFQGTPPAKPLPGANPNAAPMKPVPPDEALSAIVGSTPRPRGALIRKLWDYLKENKLQDGKKRTNINAGAALKVVFNGRKTVTIFEMTKLVSGHVRQRSPPLRL